MRISEIPHVDHGRIAVCSCQATFRIEDSTVVEEFSLPDLPPPESIGGCRIVRYIGRGATNCVYEGIHPDLGVPVAVKTMVPEYADDKPSCEQFLRAAKICAKAVHPNVVKVYEAGRGAKGVPFMIMEYLPGGTLADRILEHQRFPAREAAEIGAAVCRALTETAKLGIVHRDIKPDNIMIAADGTYKLTDLGLAKFDAPSDAGNSARVLNEDEPVKPSRKTSFGTLEYMSPEQYVDAESCDIRSDIYSLGVTLYQLAAGRLPFETMTRSELRHMHLSVEPIVPGAGVPDIPLDFDYIVLRCIQKRPEDRYQTPEELLADLEAFLAGKELPSTTCGANSVIHAPDIVLSEGKNHLPVILAAVAIVLLILIGGMLFLWKQSEAVRQETRPAATTLQQQTEPAETKQETPAIQQAEDVSPQTDLSSNARESDFSIDDKEDANSTLALFNKAMADADQALNEKSGFWQAIAKLEIFLIPQNNAVDDTPQDSEQGTGETEEQVSMRQSEEEDPVSLQYSEEAKKKISELRTAEAAAVRELIGSLDKDAEPLIKAEKWEGAIRVYEDYRGRLYQESAEARNEAVGKIRNLLEKAESAQPEGNQP